MNLLVTRLPTGLDFSNKGKLHSKYTNTWQIAYAAIQATMPSMLQKGGSYATKLVQQIFYNTIEKHGFGMFRSMLKEALSRFHVKNMSLPESFRGFMLRQQGKS